MSLAKRALELVTFYPGQSVIITDPDLMNGAVRQGFSIRAKVVAVHGYYIDIESCRPGSYHVAGITVHESQIERLP